MKKELDKPDFKTMSEAVQAWYRYYEVDPKDGLSDVLRQATIEFYQEGHRTSDDIATALIGTYVGIHATRVNAPTSAALH
ncbi:hypothetical protein [Rhizobium leguminosarum]|uniref:Uncharacterized protein n=1 Tax=Rhizobium leguminosarum TaxID=384 RepID=A0A2K9Z364_RHILE|nr:hypothetical protein [Rhizobium leguminosarum]AUW42658.1 hypothetical protein CUJ84_Chr002299 [Rhizobium leguminosarum]